MVSCKYKDDSHTNQAGENIPEFYSHIIKNSKYNLSNSINLEKMNLNNYIKRREIKEVDSLFYNKYLIKNFNINQEFEKLYFFSTYSIQDLSSLFIKVSKFNTTVYCAYLIYFSTEGKIIDALEVSKYESYPGGSVSKYSNFIKNEQIEQITLNSFIEGYDDEKEKPIIVVDSTRKIIQKDLGNFKLISSDSVRYNK